MRPALLLLILALSGCVAPLDDRAGDADAVGAGARVVFEERPAREDGGLCAQRWEFGLVEETRAREGDGARLVERVRAEARAPRRALEDVTYRMTWGKDEKEGLRAEGSLRALTTSAGAWRFLDDGDGVLGEGDAFDGWVQGARPEDAHALVELWSASGAFVGGSPRCM